MTSPSADGPPAAPGRACGECTACCEWLRIDAPDLRKPPGVLCRHACAGGGCSSYARRPEPCRVWSCEWRASTTVPETLRPDRCGVIVMETPEPPGDPALAGYVLLAFWPIAMLPIAALDALLARLIGAGMEVHLAVPGPPGDDPRSAPLNALVGEIVGRGATARLEAALRHLAALLEDSVPMRAADPAQPSFP